VPRHPERFDRVANCCSGGKELPFERSAAAGAASAVAMETQVLLVDTVGELAALYAAADVAFVGGSLVPVGGHNLLEPAALGVPVLTGPYNANSGDIARLAGAARRRGASGRCAATWRPGTARLFADPDFRRRAGGQGASSSRRIAAASRGCSSSLSRCWRSAEARP
jgi:3-deoxy-D-manno-octulosonic-acid transferase